VNYGVGRLLIPGGVPISITYEINTEQQLVYAEIQGECSLGERESLLDTVASDPGYLQGFNILYDQRECTTILTAVENRTLGRYAMRLRTKFDGIKLAIVVKGDVLRGLVKMQDRLSGPGIDVAHFSDYQEALEWVS